MTITNESGTIDTTQEKRTYTFTVPTKVARTRTFFDKLLKRPIEPTEKAYTITPCVVGTSVRIAERVALLPKEVTGGSLLEVAAPLIAEHIDNMIYIIAAAVQNNYREPSPKLITYLKKNMTTDQVFEVLNEVMEAMCLQAFFNCIVLMKGTVSIVKPDRQ